MIVVIISFLCGAIVTVVTILVAAGLWFYSLPVVPHSGKKNTARAYTPPQFSRHLEDVYTKLSSGSDTLGDESCIWFNLIVDFLFRELRDTPRMKRLVMKKVEKEFQELLLTKTEGRMLEQLTVREYFLGTSMPVVMSAEVIKVECSSDEVKTLEELEIALEVEYAGNCEIAIDADLLFNKAAYVAIQVRQMKGRGRLRFSRHPVTSWSFSFFEEPYLDLKVESHFEGRDFPQLSSFIEAQCRKYVRRKHTLPASKIRYKPFFKKQKPQDQISDVYVPTQLYVHNGRLTIGKLSVEVVKCSRLPNFDGASMVYCSVGVAVGYSAAATPWKPVIHLWKTQWPVLEFVVDKSQGQTIGMRNRKEVYEDEEESCVLIIVSDIIANSAAYAAGIRKGDVVTRVNNVRVNSVKQVTRLINKTKGRSVLITVNRPPTHFSTKLLHSDTSKSYTPSSATAPISDTMPNFNDIAGNATGAVATGISNDSLGSTCSRTSQNSSPPQMNESCNDDGTSRDHSEGNPSEILASSTTRYDDGDGGDDGECVGMYEGTGESIVVEVSTSDQVDTGQLRKRHPPGNINSNDDASPDRVLIDSESASLDSGLLESTSVSTIHTPIDDDCGSMPQSPAVDSQLTTKAVLACKNPEWMQALSFGIGERHNYLNVCVWVKLGEERGNLLVGHVTISLTDIVLECLCTSSGTHQQNYMLVAAEAAKAYASRIALQATTGSGSKTSTGREEEGTYTGDILLRFKHIPSCEASCDYQDIKDESGNERHQLHHRFTPSQGRMPSDHNFIGVEMDGLHRRCDVCHKKIWVLKSKVQECQKCGLKCHKKCIKYCMKNMPCYKKSLGNLHQRSEGDFAVYECEDKSEEVVAGNGHRCLAQEGRQRINSTESSSFEMVGIPEQNETDEGDSENGEEINPREESNSPACEKVGISSDSISESESDQVERSEATDENQSSISWYPHLQQREQSLKEKITSLKQEIERINELIEEAQSHERPDMSSTERERIQNQIAQHEDKLHPLKLLMMQLVVELNECSPENTLTELSSQYITDLCI